MFGKLGDMAQMLKAAKDIQGNMAKLQQELLRKRYDADAGAGMVRAVVDGKGTLVDIKINPDAANDVELLEDLVKAAIGQAVLKSQQAMQQEMNAMTGGMNLPGLSDFFSGGKP